MGIAIGVCLYVAAIVLLIYFGKFLKEYDEMMFEQLDVPTKNGGEQCLIRL